MLRCLREHFIVRSPMFLRKLMYTMPSDWDRRTLSEKIQWRCQNPDPLVDYALLVDKYRVKEFVRPWFRTAETYALIENAAEIDCANLPRTYVMKTTHSWNRSMLILDGVIQGQNRSHETAGDAANEVNLQTVARPWLRPHPIRSTAEIHYRFVRPRILFEEYLDEMEYELHFFLFYGKCRMTEVVTRGFDFLRGETYRNYDADWTRLEPGSKQIASCYDNSPAETPRPDSTVLRSLEELCRDIDHVRADFFVCRGEMFFGEFTFTHNRGLKSLLGKYEVKLSHYWPAAG